MMLLRLRRIAARDEAALGELYDCMSPLLYSTAVRILHNERDAEETLQDVFVQIWDKASIFDEACGSPVNWLVTIARNMADTDKMSVSTYTRSTTSRAVHPLAINRW